MDRDTKNRGNIPGLVYFICFIFMASSAFIIWLDPYCFAVFIVPIMAADGKNAGRACMFAALLEPWAAAAMFKYICYAAFLLPLARFPGLFRFNLARIRRRCCRFMIYDKRH